MEKTVKISTATITKIAAIISSLTVIIGLMWGTFKFIEAAKENTAAGQEFKEAVKSINTRLDSIETQQENTVNAIQDVNLQISDINEANIKYHQSYVQFVKDNTKTSQELFRYLEGLDLAEKKKLNKQDSAELKIIIRQIPKP